MRSKVKRVMDLIHEIQDEDYMTATASSSLKNWNMRLSMRLKKADGRKNLKTNNQPK